MSADSAPTRAESEQRLANLDRLAWLDRLRGPLALGLILGSIAVVVLLGFWLRAALT